MSGDRPPERLPGAAGELPLRERLRAQLEQGSMLIERLGTGRDALGDPGVETWVQSVAYAFREAGRPDLAELFVLDEVPPSHQMVSPMLDHGAKEFQDRKRIELKLVKLEEMISQLEAERPERR